MESNKLQ